MDVEKVIVEALAKYGLEPMDAKLFAQTTVAELTANGLTVVPNEVVGALREARAALHFHYVEWDGEPEDAVPLQLARAKCDAALAKLDNPQ